MWLSGIVTVLNLALAAAVGLRLLWRVRDGRSGPERWLAGYFLCGACLGSMGSIAVYGSLGESGLSLSEAATSRLITFYTLANAIAGTCVYAFNWRTFRPGASWAKALVCLAILCFAGAWTFQLATGEFFVQVFPGPAYWLERAIFTGAFAWAAAESLRYYAVQRRRLRVGLADAIVANRFLLWGLWAVAMAGLTLSDLVARIAYVWRTGERTLVLAEEAMPIIVVTVAITSVVGAIAAATLWLTFFPAKRYLAWIEADHSQGS